MFFKLQILKFHLSEM